MCICMYGQLYVDGREEMRAVRNESLTTSTLSLHISHPPPVYISHGRWYVEFERTAKDLAQIELRKSGKVRMHVSVLR